MPYDGTILNSGSHWKITTTQGAKARIWLYLVVDSHYPKKITRQE
jgi:hypothetical protein